LNQPPAEWSSNNTEASQSTDGINHLIDPIVGKRSKTNRLVIIANRGASRKTLRQTLSNHRQSQ
jgi:hypothetical protein